MCKLDHKSSLPMMNVCLLIDRFTTLLILEPKIANIVEVKATDTHKEELSEWMYPSC